MADEDAVTFFILTGDDLAWLAGFNRDDNRLGVAVQLCTLPWLGWTPDDLTGCPYRRCYGSPMRWPSTTRSASRAITGTSTACRPVQVPAHLHPGGDRRAAAGR
jgi:hypothetical protein